LLLFAPARTECPKAPWRPGDIEGQVTAGERTGGEEFTIAWLVG
jgi:hypothetical protein